VGGGDPREGQDGRDADRQGAGGGGLGEVAGRMLLGLEREVVAAEQPERRVGEKQRQERQVDPMTVAPPQVASCAASDPTAPSTPWTRTTLPVTGPSPNTARWAVIPGMPSAAPASSLTLSGSAIACAPGTTVHCAAVPNGR
jgi:hypothetical protein